MDVQMARKVKWTEVAWSDLKEVSGHELFVKRYRLIYQMTDQTAYIIGFIHGARDLLALWEREGRPSSRDIS